MRKVMLSIFTLLCTLFLSSIVAFAAPLATTDKNKVVLEGTATTGEQVTVKITSKKDGVIVYIDEQTCKNGKYFFETHLKDGDYLAKIAAESNEHEVAVEVNPPASSSSESTSSEAGNTTTTTPPASSKPKRSSTASDTSKADSSDSVSSVTGKKPTDSSTQSSSVASSLQKSQEVNAESHKSINPFLVIFIIVLSLAVIVTILVFLRNKFKQK